VGGFQLALGDTITSLWIWECNGIVDVTITEFTCGVYEAFTGVPEPRCVSDLWHLWDHSCSMCTKQIVLLNHRGSLAFKNPICPLLNLYSNLDPIQYNRNASYSLDY
jgi:hypothetical protein